MPLSLPVFHCHVFPFWTWFPVWMALGCCPLERGQRVSGGLPACVPFFSGEARLTQLLWQPVFPRRAAKHVRLCRESWTRSRSPENRPRGPGQPSGCFTSLGLLSKQFAMALKTQTIQPVKGQSSIPGSTPKPKLHTCVQMCTPILAWTHINTDSTPLGLWGEACIYIMELPLPHALK